MPYQKPKCDCGAELILTEEYVTEVRRRINKNGSVAKKPFYRSKPAENEDGFIALVCLDCHTAYEVEMLFKEDKRVFRGNKMYDKEATNGI